MIFIWDVDTNIFIVDTEGKLYKNLVAEFKPNYKYDYIKYAKGEVNFDISIVKSNILNKYISQSS